MAHTKSKWVIVFLIYADFRQNVKDDGNMALAMTQQMKATLDRMFKDILTVPIDPNRGKLYVVMNSIDYKEGDDSLTESKILLYTITNPMNENYNQIESCTVLNVSTDDSEDSVQNPSFLKTVLTPENIPISKNEEVFFITWDHGSAFGIFREVDPGIVQIRRPVYYDLDHFPYLAEFWNKALEKNPPFNDLMDRVMSNTPVRTVAQIGHRLFKLEAAPQTEDYLQRSIRTAQTTIPLNTETNDKDFSALRLACNKATELFEVVKETQLKNNDAKFEVAALKQEKVGDILRNEELATVFEDWLGSDKKVGVLLMMNCWMMNLHTMHSFHKTVRCLVAPQGDIGTPGYNYKAILQYIFQSDKFFISPQQLAIECVKTIETKRMRKRSKKLRDDKLDVIDTWKVFAMDLQKRDEENKLLLPQQVSVLGRLIEEINKYVRSDEGKESEARWMFKYIRSVCFDFTDKNCFIVDILTWCMSVLYVDEFFPATTRKLSIDVAALLTEFCNSVFNGEALPSVALKTTQGIKVYGAKASPPQPVAVINVNPSGYGLFFPQFDISEVLDLLSNVTTDSLMTNDLSNWKVFLRESIDKNILF